MSNRIRNVLALAAVVVAAGCQSDATVVTQARNNTIFQNYVALGNSITAGYQSAGINDSTQKQSYAVLLAKAMNTRFAYPSLVMPGCPPPIANFLTGARVSTGLPSGTTATSTTCLYRNPNSVTSILNNEAVPGAKTADIDSTVGPSANSLTTIFLGGQTQVQRALDASPTFATAWIGNNDILAAALCGMLVGCPDGSAVTSQTTFQANYDKAMAHLTSGGTLKGGVLIGVVQVANAPLLFPAAVAVASPTVLGAMSQVAGKPVTMDPVTCPVTTKTLINFQILAAIRAGQHPSTIYCEKTGVGVLGDLYILDATEQATVTADINAYNAYIQTKAAALGWAYFDPNPILLNLKATGKIPVFPDLTKPTAPFGQYISLDGVHPAAAAHLLIADGLVGVINTKYGTTLVAP